MAARVRAGSIVGIGDTVSTLHPQSADGVNVAMDDAEHAVGLLLRLRAAPQGRERAFGDFERDLLASHEKAVQRSMRATRSTAPELEPPKPTPPPAAEPAAAPRVAATTPATPAAQPAAPAPQREGRFLRFLHAITGVD
jgi:2-polyprenyl-6-methoxyphenol hydroxylase-like FAD-dependent oxidoreductase